MKKFLPGFTLVELLVVISIIAILSLIGLTVYTNVQKNARDAKRKADIDAIANAMEANYGSGLYTALAVNMFSSGTIPQDPINTPGTGTDPATCPKVCKYCVSQDSAIQTGAACTVAITTVATTGMPGGGLSNPYWAVCANLESGSPNFYCRSNTQ